MNEPKDMAEPQASALKAMYEQVAKQHDRIDDFRAKLLGFLPFVTGIGLFALVGKSPTATASASVVDSNLVMAIGIFGAIASIGLFVHELRGIINCYMLVRIGGELEKLMNEEKQDVACAEFGPFYSQFALGKKLENKADKSNMVDRLKANKQEDTVNQWEKWLNRIGNILNPVSVDRDTAALIVYSATIAAWAVLAAWSQSFSQLLVLAFGVFVVSALIGAFILERHYSKIQTYIEYSVQHLKHPKSADEVTTTEYNLRDAVVALLFYTVLPVGAALAFALPGLFSAVVHGAIYYEAGRLITYQSEAEFAVFVGLRSVIVFASTVYGGIKLSAWLRAFGNRHSPIE